MRFYVKEIQTNEIHKRTAGTKAREDIERIFDEEGLEAILIPSIFGQRELESTLNKAILHRKVYHEWTRKMRCLRKDDVVFVQFPVVEHSIFLTRVFSVLKKNGVKVVLIIHDLELFRYARRKDLALKRRFRIYLEEKTILKSVDSIVVHNASMKQQLEAITSFQPEKIVILGLFDYLVPEGTEDSRKLYSKRAPVVISGNLDPAKAGYVYRLPDKPEFNLYGVNYEDSPIQTVHYCGSFSSSEIPFAMEGSFGLVWDGATADTCGGVFGEYLKINNPHKISLYLASGLPVIIWKEAALAPLVEGEGIGILIDNISQIEQVTNSISEDDYIRMLENVERFTIRLRKGLYTREMLKTCYQICGI